MSDIWTNVRQLEGSTLKTLRSSKPFEILTVTNDAVRLRPLAGKQVVRSVQREQIERIAALHLDRDAIRQCTEEEYPTNQNTSYIAAIAYEAGRRARVTR